MKRILKREYTAEFKELAVKRVRSGETVGAVGRDLGLVEQTLRNWVKAAKAGKLHPPGVKPVTPEQMELSRVRAENARLIKERFEELARFFAVPDAIGVAAPSVTRLDVDSETPRAEPVRGVAQRVEAARLAASWS